MRASRALRVAAVHQLGHVDPRAAVGEDDRQQDQAVRRPYQHDAQVHSDKGKEN